MEEKKKRKSRRILKKGLVDGLALWILALAVVGAVSLWGKGAGVMMIVALVGMIKITCEET